MAKRNGANVPEAIRRLNQAGYTVRQIAGDLAVTDSTVYRWRNGTRFPNPANFAALAELVDARYSQHIHRRTLTTAALHLEQAARALETDADRAEQEQLAARLAEAMAQAEQRRQAELEQRSAEARAIRDEVTGQARRDRLTRNLRAIEARPVRSPFRSITREVDPFELVQNTQLRQAQEIEEAFN